MSRSRSQQTPKSIKPCYVSVSPWSKSFFFPFLGGGFCLDMGLSLTTISTNKLTCTLSSRQTRIWATATDLSWWSWAGSQSHRSDRSGWSNPGHHPESEIIKGLKTFRVWCERKPIIGPNLPLLALVNLFIRKAIWYPNLSILKY